MNSFRISSSKGEVRRIGGDHKCVELEEMRAPSGLNEEVNSAQHQVKESDVAEKFFERAVDSTMGRDLQVQTHRQSRPLDAVVNLPPQFQRGGRI
eukprot:85869-Amphidinium_carterae.1